MYLALTGGSGFVGSHIIRENGKRNQPFNIRGLFRNESAAPSCRFLEVCHGEVNDFSRLFPDKPHVLVHFAVKQLDLDGEGYDRVNVDGLENVLGQCNKNTKGILYASTLSVLGQGCQDGVTEDCPVAPSMPLSISRLKAEQLVSDFGRQLNIPTYNMRPRFILGQGDRFVIPNLVKIMSKGIYLGSGKQRYSIINAQDYARIVLSLAEKMLSERLEPEQSALNIGYEQPASYDDIFQCLIKVSGRQIRKIKVPLPNWLPGVLKKLPSEVVQSKATQLELVGFSHFGCVNKLKQLVGPELVCRPVDSVLTEAISSYLEEL